MSILSKSNNLFMSSLKNKYLYSILGLSNSNIARENVKINQFFYLALNQLNKNCSL